MSLSFTQFYFPVATSKSNIMGTGLFSVANIRAGQTIMEWGGLLVAASEVERVGRMNSIVRVNDGRYMVDPVDGPAYLDEFINHSCDPNMGMASDVRIIARRDIMPCEELTLDYGTYHSIQWVFDPSWVMPCQCRSEHCRRAVRSTDHLLPALQARYGTLFAPYLRREQSQHAPTQVVEVLRE